MKKIILATAILLCLLKTDSLFAQEGETSLHGLSAKLLFIDYSMPNDGDDFKITNGLELAYIRSLGDHLAVGIPLKIGVAKPVAEEEERLTFVGVDVIGQYVFTEPESRFGPYLFGGLGINFDKFDNNNVQLPVGAGLYQRIGESSFITLQAEFRKSLEENRDNIQFGIGWHFKLKQAPRPPGPPDADNDGLPDAQDLCPDEPGTALANGCPDSDDDGVPNGQDDCPLEKGPAANNGCPAPNDRDEDGIPDEKDKCPDTKGIQALEGCPPATANAIDSDGDGVTDDKDECPDTAGRIPLLGCPDADNDGVADIHDLCPEEPGLPVRNGCPAKDSDGDGLLDEEDDCPNTPGNKITGGCPDKDGDGVGDATDECPDTPGFASTKGCPDTDLDGVADIYDRCPKIPGEVGREGCPFIDSDGDTVADEDDECPDEKGSPDLLGCPDADGDGIPDRVDKCPEEKGIAERNGCPVRDRDEDGVEDHEDRCPDVKGSAKAAGCPDSDDDGFGDSFDKCPDEAGTNEGCPDLEEEDKEFLKMAARNIHFETGKTTLKAKSYTTLDQVAAIMKKYPRYHLRIGGHTDNVGNDETNRLLSEERAKVCREYLLSRGISADRMQSKGFGESEPIASNRTEEGRLANRRVTFTVYLP